MHIQDIAGYPKLILDLKEGFHLYLPMDTMLKSAPMLRRFHIITCDRNKRIESASCHANYIYISLVVVCDLHGICGTVGGVTERVL